MVCGEPRHWLCLAKMIVKMIVKGKETVTVGAFAVTAVEQA
jgi:hypothetical protein